MLAWSWQPYSAKERIELSLGDQIMFDDAKKKSDGKEGVKWWLLGHLSFFLWGLGHNGFSLRIHVCQRGSKRSNHATSEEAGPIRPFSMKNRSYSSRYWTGSSRQAPNPMHESEMLWPKVQNDVSYKPL
jgi:hypothetical protein